MNPIDQHLDRLFRAAAQVGPKPAVTPPYGLETRVLAAWREAGVPGGFSWNTSLLVRGLMLASLIMAVSFWPVVDKAGNPFSEYLQLADSSVQLDSTPSP